MPKVLVKKSSRVLLMEGGVMEERFVATRASQNDGSQNLEYQRGECKTWKRKTNEKRQISELLPKV